MSSQATPLSIQSSKLIILKGWRAGTQERVHIRKELNLFQNPRESVTLGASLWVDDDPLRAPDCAEDYYRCGYDVTLQFNTPLEDDADREYEYKIGFHVKRVEDGGDDATALFERKKVRSSDGAMKFSGEFIAPDLFLTKYDDVDEELPVVNYRLYCRIRRWIRLRDSDTESLSSSSSEESLAEDRSRYDKKAERDTEDASELRETIKRLEASVASHRRHCQIQMIRNKCMRQDESRGETSKVSPARDESRAENDSGELREEVERLKVAAENQKEDYEAKVRGKELELCFEVSKTTELRLEVDRLKEREHALSSQLELQTRLQNGLEKQIGVLDAATGKQRELQDILVKKIEKLKLEMENERGQHRTRLDQKQSFYDAMTSSQIGKIEELKEKVGELGETEVNLLAQLQDTDQRAQSEVQELKGKIAQLELSARSQRVQHKSQMDELSESLKCCVCCVNQVDIVWIPCGHAKFCDNCVKDNQRTGVQPNVCMICRQSGKAHKLIL